jgi:hypothetical protein
VVADPQDLVPESNERNNLVALSLHVNHLPEILDLQVSRPGGINPFPQQMAYVQFNFTYRDRDSDGGVSMSLKASGEHDSTSLTTPDGDLTVGVSVHGSAEISLGDTELVLEVDDGRAMVNETFTVHANFGIRVEDLGDGRDDRGDLRFMVWIEEPWEGTSMDSVELALVEPGLDPRDMADWNAELFHTATWNGDEWVYDASSFEAGTYDVWVLAMDDRAIRAIHVEEDLAIEALDTDDGTEWYTWAFAALIIIAMISLALALARGRSSP